MVAKGTKRLKRRAGALGSLVGVALIASLVGGPDAAVASGPGKGPEVGVQFHALWSDYSDRQRRRALDKLEAAGVGWVRIDLGWESLQPARSRFSDDAIALTDEVVDAARRRGMKVLFTVWATPGWANGGSSRIVPPRYPASFGTFMLWASNHFAGRVDAWEIWNEPNDDDFFRGSVRDYVSLLREAYLNVKVGDPNAKIVLGGPSYNDTDWISRVYALGGGPFFDVMATHPYQGVADAPPDLPDDGTIWTLAHVAAVHRLMSDNGDGSKPIWFTEFGWSAHRDRPGEENWERGVSPRTQGRYLIDTLRLVRSDFPYVKKVFWYNERNRRTGDVQLDHYGLMQRDLSPKPAYRMLRSYLTS